MIALRNDYHDTIVRLRAKFGQELSRGQIRRSSSVLCGIDECTCGGILGERGKDNPHVELIGQRDDGSCRVRIIEEID
jgi:hypothetical protein